MTPASGGSFICLNCGHMELDGGKKAKPPKNQPTPAAPLPATPPVMASSPTPPLPPPSKPVPIVGPPPEPTPTIAPPPPAGPVILNAELAQRPLGPEITSAVMPPQPSAPTLASRSLKITKRGTNHKLFWLASGGIGVILITSLLIYAGVIRGHLSYIDQQKQLTAVILNDTAIKIADFKSKNNRIPVSLNELGGSSFITDSWGHPLIYQISGNGTYKLSSAGPDGVPGNADDITPTK